MATACRNFIVLLTFSHITVTMGDENAATIGPSIDTKEEDYVSKQHKTDSLTILMLLGLLVIAIMTVWLFKHRRFRFVHETGLSMIYGLGVGAIIRYTSAFSLELTAHAELQEYNKSEAPSSLYVEFPTSPGSNSTTTYKYNLKSIVTSVEEEAALEKTVTFDPELFFNVLLPIIIFEAGYSMKRRHFFKNLGAIMTYAFIGTTISCMVVGGIMYGLTRVMDIHDIFHLNDCFFFGAIISATDPVTVLAIFGELNVDVDLYALVFGESVLNDAVAIVLSASVEKYSQTSGESFSAVSFFKAFGNFVGIFAGAFAIGTVMGCATALVTKYTKIRDFPLLESALFVLFSYSSFQAAEAAGLTGIVAVLFCGIAQAHYTYNNLSEESKQNTKKTFELFNFLAETFVFLYIGVSVFTLEYQKWHAGFICGAFFAIIVARMCNVYPLSFLLNLGRTNKIRASIMHMMMFAGLRGAIAFALAIRNTANEARELMVSATMMIVLVTVILCGGLTTPMLQWLQIRVGVEEEAHASSDAVRSAMSRQRQYSTMENPADSTSPSQLTSGPSPVEQEIRTRAYGKAYLVAKWYKFDMRYMKPFLTNSRPSLMETLPKCCLPLAKLLTTEEQLTQGVVHPDNDSDTDMIIDHSEISIGEASNISSNPSINSPAVNSEQPDNKNHVEVKEEDSSTGDLGLGEGTQPVHVRVKLGGEHKGDLV